MQKLLNTKEASSYLGLKPETLIVWRHKGVGPRYIKVGFNVRYTADILDEYLKHNTVTPEDHRKQDV